MKRLVVFLLVLALALPVVAASRWPRPRSKSGSCSPAMPMWRSCSRTSKAEFEAKNADVEVNLQFIPWH